MPKEDIPEYQTRKETNFSYEMYKRDLLKFGKIWGWGEGLNKMTRNQDARFYLKRSRIEFFKSLRKEYKVGLVDQEIKIVISTTPTGHLLIRNSQQRWMLFIAKMRYVVNIVYILT